MKIPVGILLNLSSLNQFFFQLFLPQSKSYLRVLHLLPEHQTALPKKNLPIGSLLNLPTFYQFFPQLCLPYHATTSQLQHYVLFRRVWKYTLHIGRYANSRVVACSSTPLGCARWWPRCRRRQCDSAVAGDVAQKHQVHKSTGDIASKRETKANVS